MDIRMRRRMPGFRWRLAAGTAALAALVGTAVVPPAQAAADGPGVRVENRRLALPESRGSDDRVRIDTSYYTAGDAGRRPAVLLGHGFGGSKRDLDTEARRLAQHGYAVLTWSARGFGGSTGKIGINDPDNEVNDVSRLIDWLARQPEVQLDHRGDPRVGVTGASYGGAASLLAAGYDDRVDAIAPQNTYWNLADALFPNGVFKKMWAGFFFTTGSFGTALGGTGASGAPVPSSRTDTGCGRFEKPLCAMYHRVASSGKPDDEARRMLEARSPSAVGDRIDVPTLIMQGQSDSLFPLSNADAMAKKIKSNGAPVSVDWLAGGHDGGDQETDRVRARVTHWFDRYLKGDRNADTGPPFRVSRSGGVDTTDGRARLRGATGDRYPGLDGTATRTVPLTGREQHVENPAGGNPPAISGVPGAGGFDRLAAVGGGVSVDYPGQTATFESRPLKKAVRLTGSPTARVNVTAPDGAVLFAKVYDVGPDGQQLLPARLVTPVRITGAGKGRSVELRLPPVDHEFAAGHRMRLALAATDLAYSSPAEPATYSVSLDSPGLTVPTAPGVRTDPAASSLPWWVWGLPAGGALIAAALLLTGRRRTSAPGADPGPADVPLVIDGLTKRYARSEDRYAVQDLSFRVERGQVLGLLGPNGAGKTTTLRMLMGLIRPDSGDIRVFGRPVVPGAPVLSRVGAFVEGAGSLPHLTGRANLDLYWKATGRPAADARVEEALGIAGLGDAIDRPVRTYSQGMRQRLAIAQAMLGLPDLLILDEPTNGLDPSQIREMREVLVRYAADGRTVIVSSHLLAEVEQCCTHLVVMDRGRLVTAGPVAEITGDGGDTLLVGVAGGPPSQVVLDKVAALPGVASAAVTETGMLVRLDGVTAQAFLADLVRLEIPVDRFGTEHRLEDAFLTLIGGSA